VDSALFAFRMTLNWLLSLWQTCFGKDVQVVEVKKEDPVDPTPYRVDPDWDGII
jgi:hypothetical protein